jgi:hypothetical protein
LSTPSSHADAGDPDDDEAHPPVEDPLDPLQEEELQLPPLAEALAADALDDEALLFVMEALAADALAEALWEAEPPIVADAPDTDALPPRDDELTLAAEALVESSGSSPLVLEERPPLLLADSAGSPDDDAVSVELDPLMGEQDAQNRTSRRLKDADDFTGRSKGRSAGCVLETSGVPLVNSSSTKRANVGCCRLVTCGFASTDTLPLRPIHGSRGWAEPQ